MKNNRIIPYNPNVKALARELRKNSTLAEVLLWNQLKGKQMMDHEFHWQVPIDAYIVDFYCHELNLALEVDGNSHQSKPEEDRVRQGRLESFGVRLLRFDDQEIKKNITNVLWSIQCWIEENGPPTSP